MPKKAKGRGKEVSPIERPGAPLAVMMAFVEARLLMPKGFFT